MDNVSLNRIKEYFNGKPVLRAYIFGSEARNEAVAESDIDILVELDYSNPIGLEFIRMKLELEKIFNKKIDLLSAKGISKYIQAFIDRDKILIYEK